MNIKKQLYLIITALMFMSFVLLMFSSAQNISKTVSSNQVKILPQLVIDAGHGGEDGGAVSDNGILEKDINLQISNDTADLLYLLGYDTIKTRSSDVDLANGENSIRQRKVSDMKKRLKMFNSTDNNVVISIHQNKFTESKYNGTQIFYSPNDEKSKELADNIRFSVKKLLQPYNERECKKADKGIYLLKNSKVPAVIVECGFLSNYNECNKLIQNEYQKQVAFSIVSGFLNYTNT